MEEEITIESLIGKTICQITNNGDEIVFTCTDGEQFKMYHSQDCCESVGVDDIVGDIGDILNSPILRASEDSSGENPVDKADYEAESFTWTFYNIATIKGQITIRWYGSSNGYYSEGVDFVKL